VEDNTEPRFLVIGQIGKPHGVHGEMRVVPYTDLPERFTWLEEVYVGQDRPILVPIEHVRFHKNWVLLKLAGTDDRDAAALFNGQLLLVDESQAIPLEEGEYYLYQLEGLSVISDQGLDLGIIVEVMETGANNVFVVRGEDGQLLIPDTKEIVLDIDFDNARMTVHIIPGLLSP
jgi:16S rRNA processing protein RimM